MMNVTYASAMLVDDQARGLSAGSRGAERPREGTRVTHDSRAY